MDTMADVWKEVLAVCKTKVSDIMFNLWIEPLELIKFENDTFIFLINSEFKKSIILDKFSGLIKDSFEEVMGFPVEIDILVDSAADAKEMRAHADGKIKDTAVSSAGKQFTFDSFIVGKSNNFAYNVSLGVAQHPGTLYNPLMIWGRSGLGKTHLLYAIYNEMKKNNPDKVIIYVPCETFMNELIEGMAKHNTIAFHQKYRNVDALLMDDIQILKNTVSVQEEFFHTFNALEQAGKQIVLTADVAPRELVVLDDRLRSRFEMGIMADIQPPDIDTRKAIILRKCEQLNMTLPDNITEFIAQRIKNNIRQLEGTVKKISAMRMSYGDNVTLEQVQDIIKDITTDNQPVSVLVEKIIDFTAKNFGVSAQDIRSDKRQAEITLARQVTIYVIKEVTTLKLEEIGKYFGKNHSTVLYSINQAKEKMDEAPSVKAIAISAINEFQTK